jgi:glucose-6-phosphate 1-epimerase
MDAKKYADYEIPGKIAIVEGRGGLALLRVSTDYSDAEIYLYGAHVASFRPSGGDELFWLSDLSPFTPGKAIRGGVPVCFPWFGPHRSNPELPAHGFARIREWEIGSTALLSDGRARVTLCLSSSDDTLKIWPHRFLLEMSLTIGREIELELRATNTGDEPFSYEDCFHSYFKVADSGRTAVSGLEGLCCLDRLKADKPSLNSDAIRVSEPVTALFPIAGRRAEIADEAKGRTIACEQDGFKGTVVWSPWETALTAFKDIGPKWREFLCVEAVNCREASVTLLPGTSHSSRVKYGLK